MGSAGEPDRKRRHFSSISMKNHLLSPCPDDKKVDVAVLQFQNQKLFQQLEAQKIEFFVLDEKYNKFKEQQQVFEDATVIVNKCWDQLVNDLELRSICTSESANSQHYLQDNSMVEDGTSLPIEDDFLSRLLETGSTECCSYNGFDDREGDCTRMPNGTTEVILQNIIDSINSIWHASDGVTSQLQATLLEDDPDFRLQNSIDELRIEIRRLITTLNDLHLKHRLMSSQILNFRDMDAKFKAEQRRLTDALARTVIELEGGNAKLAILKAQGDGSKGAPIIFPILGNKSIVRDVARNTQQEIHEMETSHKELKDLVSNQMVEISNLHERRSEILRKLVNLQNTLVDVKGISSSRAFMVLKGMLDKARAGLDGFRISLEKLQVEKENFIWLEKEVTVKAGLADVYKKISDLSESHLAEFEQELQKFIQEQYLLETKLEEALKEPGRKEIIVEFQELIYSIPKEIGLIENELSKLKETACEIHCLRAQMQSLSNILARESKELQSLTVKSGKQLSEIERLHLVVGALRESEQEFKLILEMYHRESMDSRDVLESRDIEFKAWAHVHCLKSSLDEYSLEARVKTAIEAEAICQRRLATTEADVADLRQKLELSVRVVSVSSETLKSKYEESEGYVSEIESIGQAYRDMQAQNQHLLQQVTERNACNIKVVISKCYHLFCTQCVQRTIESRHRKCPTCSMSFGLNDVKPIYL